jgi:hypothetical protein
MAFAAAMIFVGGHFSEASAQRDPFKKASWAIPKKEPVGGVSSASSATKPPVNYGPPGIEARIEYFKRLREQAAANGQPLPKVTSVLTLNEMSVTGIFKTPRGYAAMVQAVPINLSYTIYPGEKFFDGQLVAVEENRLVFRKVTKVGAGKFVASVENKPLKQFSMKEQVQGTASAQEKPVETAANTPPADGSKSSKPASTNPFLSPVDEMNSLPAAEPEKGKDKKGQKKPAKVAKNSDQ